MLISLLFLLQLHVAALTPGPAELAGGFHEPPESARCWTYWWWLDSYATKEGITRDLEEMKRQGIGGVLLFDAGEGKGSPVGPVFMSDAWRDLFKHAVREAHRLGIEVGVNLCSGWNAGGTWVTPEYAAKKLVYAEATARGPNDVTLSLPQPAATDGYYRDIAVLAFRAKRPNPNKSVEGKEARRPGIKNWELKSANRELRGQPSGAQYDEYPAVAGEQDCNSVEVLDLSGRMDKAGQFVWKAPEGNWTILRFGCTLLGSKTKCTSPGAQGYEIDFFSAEAMDLHFAQTGEKLAADARDYLGKTLKYFHVDSYESGEPTWTPGFREEFRAHRRYDMLPYLPVLAGRIFDSREISNRFLWDYRRTIGDLFAERYYGRLRELSQRHGLGTHPESGGPFWPHIDALQCEGINDIPMGEFWKRMQEPDGQIWWVQDYNICDTVKQAASAAHVYGKRLCQAEAFTSMGPNWEEDPFMLKDIGDRAFCAGLTRNVLCFYVHQPRLDIKPGYQWEAAGTHFDRNITWWNMIGAWLTYLSRCQFLLQQGLFVADVCYFYGEDVPNFVPAKTHMQPPLPPGYDCDTINAEALLGRMSVKNNRLVLPDGMSYRLLVLPDRPTMSPQVLRKIKELVVAGATVVGPKPQRAPGLTGYPQCDAQVRPLADELWGDSNAQPVEERRVGKGRIIRGKTLQRIFQDDGIAPDFAYESELKDASLDYIHRTVGRMEIYFISNQKSRTERATCLFRVGDKRPQVWDPVTGEQWSAADFRQAKGRTALPLEFAPRQSWFVVFGGPRSLVEEQPSFVKLAPVCELTGPWTVRFDPAWGGPESAAFEKLQDWTSRPEEGIKYYSGTATYRKTFDLPKPSGRRLYLDLGIVKNLAEVRLNGENLGVVWTAPWRVEISKLVQPKDNRLEIDVVNLWPNRLIGDAGLPPEKRLTVTNVRKFKKDSPLLESGLLGPVTLLTSE